MRALVTGGTGRIGSAVVERLRAEGWSVIAAGRDDGDLADVEATHALVARAVEGLGGLDLLVNAAGEGFVPKPVAAITEPDWDARSEPRRREPSSSRRPQLRTCVRAKASSS
jgi:NAD(P)-dependent dehydrogenase (short-subunit alcohol dehydrogenase family)